MKPNIVLLALRKHGQMTLGKLAEKTGMPLGAVSASMGGFHDVGLVTKYGSRETSLVRWEGPDTPWVVRQVELAQSLGVAP